MSTESILRQDIRRSFNHVRKLVTGYSGLYPGEDLIRDVLGLCDEMALLIEPDQRLCDARRIAVERCRSLAQAADRFSDRDPLVIAAARAHAIAAIDALQDAIFELRKLTLPVPRTGLALRRKSL